MKNKYLFLIAAACLSIASCASGRNFSAKGTVLNIEYGKDGYTAHMIGNDGKDYDAVISRAKLEKSYRVLEAGEEVELSGDTLHFDNKVRILVRKIN